MGKVKRVMRCYHCGEVLQSAKENEKGFIGRSHLLAPNAEKEVLYCFSCYEKMKAINTGMLERDADEEILKILDDAVATDAVIIWVVDLFSFNGTLNPDVVNKVKKLKVIVAGTKFDLFPRNTKKEQLKTFINERFAEFGLTPYGVVLFGNTDNIDIANMLNSLSEVRAGHDVYMIGSYTSGKTTLINRMLKSYTNNTRRAIKTEVYPGTSVKLLEIPFSNSASFYEVPGFSLVTSTLGKVEKDIQKIITPKKEIKTTTRILSPGETLLIGSLASFELISGKPTTFKLYTAEMVESKKVLSKKARETMMENYDKKFLRPVSSRFNTFTDYDLFDYTMEKDGKVHDIGIAGLCWASFVAKGQVIRVMFPKGAALKEYLGKLR
ncbi:MAG: hypothetical protein PHI75_02220 [Bacilli bacterium]|jgi:hypothetical protein|nr:hypothetical protein [Bacilli bacterium]MDD3068705.1 hypothetical protein [Bacilli bacterium]MDD3841516.1 hypothetical protein [Bacilli bacterium]